MPPFSYALACLFLITAICMQIAKACDENTIGVVAILGTTYSGHFEDVTAIDAALGAHPVSVAP